MKLMKHILEAKKGGAKGRAYTNKSVPVGLLERDGRVYTRVVVNLIAQKPNVDN